MKNLLTGRCIVVIAPQAMWCNSMHIHLHLHTYTCTHRKTYICTCTLASKIDRKAENTANYEPAH